MPKSFGLPFEQNSLRFEFAASSFWGGSAGTIQLQDGRLGEKLVGMDGKNGARIPAPRSRRLCVLGESTQRIRGRKCADAICVHHKIAVVRKHLGACLLCWIGRAWPLGVFQAAKAAFRDRKSKPDRRTPSPNGGPTTGTRAAAKRKIGSRGGPQKPRTRPRHHAFGAERRDFEQHPQELVAPSKKQRPEIAARRLEPHRPHPAIRRANRRGLGTVAIHFDSVHGDFLKRLREKHPQLAPNDHRLCAYLRMNLTTKEIPTCSIFRCAGWKAANMAPQKNGPAGRCQSWGGHERDIKGVANF